MGNCNPQPGDRTSGFNMADYDRLPKAVRKALAGSLENWNGSQIYREYRKPRAQRSALAANAATLVATIETRDRDRSAEAAANGLTLDQSGFKPLYARRVRTGRRIYV